jgi:parallel beta-helix repeat protein
VLHAGSDRNVIRRNHIRFSDAGVGIDQSQDNLIADNTLYGNHFVGVYAFGASGNKIARNRVVRNGEGSEGGIHVLDDDSSTPSQGNTLIANKVIASVGDGIWVEAGSQATFLVGNTVVGSSKDGIKVDEPRVTLTRNLAAHNQDLGIRAVPGVIDGGGNTARANGDNAQCLHVECT